MNTVSIKHGPGLQDYLLKEDDNTVLKMRYTQESHVARVETEVERRVLMIDDEGLLRKKLILKNEYGVRIGSLTYDQFSDSQGSVDIENTRYRFLVRNTSVPELYIYRGSRRNLIYNCQLPPIDNDSKGSKSQPA